MRFVFILGKPSLISAACEDAVFELRHSRSSMGDEVELFLVLGTTPLQPLISMKIRYFVSLPESQLHEICPHF